MCPLLDASLRPAPNLSPLSPSTTAPPRPLPRAAASYRIVDEPSELSGVTDEALNLVVWRRRLPASVAAALAAWSNRTGPKLDAYVDPLSYDLGPVLEGLGDAAAREWLLADLALLVGCLAGCSRAPRLRVCFASVSDDQCRKFHVDYLRFRLMTTYVGPGTEWLPDEAVDRAALERALDRERAVGGPSEENRRIVLDARKVRRARAGEVLLMKGAHVAGCGRALVHRSPPVAGRGATRLVFTASAYQPAEAPR